MACRSGQLFVDFAEAGIRRHEIEDLLGCRFEDRSRNFSQSLAIADVQAANEIGLEERLFQSVLGPIRPLAGQPQESMGEKCVGSLSDVHPELETVFGGRSREVVDDRIGTLWTSELLGVALPSRDRAILGGRGIELVCPIDERDLDRFVAVAQSVDRPVEAALSDVAPGADHVGPDLDLQYLRHPLFRDLAHDLTLIGHLARPLSTDRRFVLVAFSLMGLDDRQSNEESTADVQATFCSTLVDEWVSLGVVNAFVAPGSRSTPMVLALAGDSRVDVHVFHDERSAAFAALGAGMCSGRPSLVVCTSGTAATHFHAAVVEADLAGVPMIAVTADRPPELHGVGAPQTIRQDHLYGEAAHWFCDPGVPTSASDSTWRDLAVRCVRESLRVPMGAIHLNLPFREPLVGTARELPVESSHSGVIPSRLLLDSDVVSRLVSEWSVRRPLLIAGRGTAPSVIETAIGRGWPVLAESRVRSVSDVITHFDSLVRHAPFADGEIPDLVVRVGDPPASKVLGQWLVRHGVRQVHVSVDGRVYDPDRVVAERIVCESEGLTAVLAEVDPSDVEWADRWSSAERAARDAVDTVLRSEELSGVGSVVTFARSLPDDAAIVVSSSMPIRDLEWFAGSLGRRRVFSNRGANGIDGVIATAIGVATEHRGPVGVLIGDVATLHDSSSLAALSSRGLDVRILVVDNDGGGIFHHLPQKTVLEPAVFELLYGTSHGTDLVALARAHGIDSVVVSDRHELERVASMPGPRLCVVRTDRERDVAAHHLLHRRVAEALGSKI